MEKATSALYEQHRTLQPKVDQLAMLADVIGEAPARPLRAGLDEVYGFLSGDLKAHGQAEREVLYPMVARMMGAPDAVATMARDHEEVDKMVQRLGAARAAVDGNQVSETSAKELRKLLYGLYAVLSVHLIKEEELYFPMLDRLLTPEEATRLMRDLERATEQARNGDGDGSRH